MSWERKFYDIYIKPFRGVYENPREKVWRVEEDMEVMAILITISTWENLPVKVGVCIDGAGVDKGADGSDKVLACLTTPATGGGSSSIYASVYAKVRSGREINVYVWGHNMNRRALDFHAQIIIYYKVFKQL